MSNSRKVKIIGTGSYLPEKILSNADFEKMIEVTDEWIVTRTGVKERRIAGKEEFSSTMGILAAKRAMEVAGITAEEIDFIIVATITPDYAFPSTACLIQEGLKAKKAAAVDINAACSGCLYALMMAKAMIESGSAKNILIIAAEKFSSIVNYKDRSTCILFGDGAAANVVSGRGDRDGLEVRSLCLGADGEQANLLIMPAGGCRNPPSYKTVEEGMHFVQMAGNEVFRHAVRQMESSCKECLQLLGMQESSINWLIPHQANERIIDAIARRFRHLPPEKIIKTVKKYGNTSASSIGIALDELLRGGGVQEGENILLTAFGAGFTWGSAILTKVAT